MRTITFIFEFLPLPKSRKVSICIFRAGSNIINFATIRIQNVLGSLFDYFLVLNPIPLVEDWYLTRMQFRTLSISVFWLMFGPLHYCVFSRTKLILWHLHEAPLGQRRHLGHRWSKVFQLFVGAAVGFLEWPLVYLSCSKRLCVWEHTLHQWHCWHT